MLYVFIIMVIVNIEFLNVYDVKRGSDFIVNITNVVKWDYKRLIM